MQKFVTNLWFDKGGEEAAAFYVSLFENSRIKDISYYDDATAAASGQPKGSALVVTFELDGQEYSILNGGPLFPLSEAVSIMVKCEDQAEVDRLWDALTADGGQTSQCGWLKDRWGLSWQIVPKRLEELASDPDKEKVGRTMAAMMKMTKLDINELERAFNGEA
jgi:predicted 3-demethylubiquinone-9 3-methyltransferase (glyoxalase superfamily)